MGWDRISQWQTMSSPTSSSPISRTMTMRNSKVKKTIQSRAVMRQQLFVIIIAWIGWTKTASSANGKLISQTLHSHRQLTLTESIATMPLQIAVECNTTRTIRVWNTWTMPTVISSVHRSSSRCYRQRIVRHIVPIISHRWIVIIKYRTGTLRPTSTSNRRLSRHSIPPIRRIFARTICRHSIIIIRMRTWICEIWWACPTGIYFCVENVNSARSTFFLLCFRAHCKIHDPVNWNWILEHKNISKWNWRECLSRCRLVARKNVCVL